MSQKEERLLVRKRCAELEAKRGLSKTITFRQIISAGAQEKGKQ